MSGKNEVGAQARIRLGAIRHNLRVVRDKAAGARVMAVVKANAYGHGLLEVARCLQDVDALAVARFSEARRLREAGVDTSIAVLGGPLAIGDIAAARDLDVQVAIHDAEQLDWLQSAAAPVRRIWLKVDTGMHRLGIRPDAVAAALAIVRQHAARVGLMTHFANADDPREPTPASQLDQFLPLLENFDGDVSVANSPGLLALPELRDLLRPFLEDQRLWVRPGLSLYGLSPFPESHGAAIGLKPAMQLESRLLSVKKLRRGDRVGYGGTWQAPVDTTLGIVAAGYGDGYRRSIPAGTRVIVNGRDAWVVGRISMDLTAVDLGADATDKVGDPVILWGDNLPAEEIARAAGTIPYELVTGVTHREAPIFED